MSIAARIALNRWSASALAVYLIVVFFSGLQPYLYETGKSFAFPGMAVCILPVVALGCATILGRPGMLRRLAGQWPFKWLLAFGLITTAWFVLFPQSPGALLELKNRFYAAVIILFAMVCMNHPRGRSWFFCCRGEPV